MFVSFYVFSFSLLHCVGYKTELKKALLWRHCQEIDSGRQFLLFFNYAICLNNSVVYLELAIWGFFTSYLLWLAGD